MQQFELEIAGRKVQFKTSYDQEHIHKMQKKISEVLEVLASPDLEPKSVKALLLMILSLVSENVDAGLGTAVNWQEFLRSMDSWIISIDQALDAAE